MLWTLIPSPAINSFRPCLPSYLRSASAILGAAGGASYRSLLVLEAASIGTNTMLRAIALQAMFVKSVVLDSRDD